MMATASNIASFGIPNTSKPEITVFHSTGKAELVTSGISSGQKKPVIKIAPPI